MLRMTGEDDFLRRGTKAVVALTTPNTLISYVALIVWKYIYKNNKEESKERTGRETRASRRKKKNTSAETA